MDFFKNFKTIKLLSNHGKYLVATDDGATVRQSRKASNRSHWLIETIDQNPNSIRIKNCSQGTYLTASTAAFLLGMTGNKVVLTVPENSRDPATEWEPVKDGLFLKLKAFGGNYLRANGGTPPWRNSVTHDKPATESTRGWVLWGVEKAEDDDVTNGCLSPMSSFSSDGSEVGSPLHSFGSSQRSSGQKVLGPNLLAMDINDEDDCTADRVGLPRGVLVNTLI